MQDIRIALAQITCLLGSLDDNLTKHRNYTRQAASNGARIVCFPELSLTGYPHDKSIAEQFAQPIHGPLAREIDDISRDCGTAVLAGFLERDPAGAIYNTQLVASPGSPLQTYRKVHVPNTENDRFIPGGALPVFTLDQITFGVQICYDNHYPESARSLALRGAELIFAPYGSPGPCTNEGLEAKRTRWLRYLTARAFDNSIYVAAVNQVGCGRPRQDNLPKHDTPNLASTPHDTHAEMCEFPGGTLVLDPWGEVIATPKPLVEDLLIVELTAEPFDKKRGDTLQFFDNFRRPDLYTDLV